MAEDKLKVLLLTIKQANADYDSGIIDSNELKRIVKQVHNEFKALEAAELQQVGSSLINLLTS
ncbi:hypothetical protein [Croceivirga sp. JEA036]|uniref:hypothetical protein n=1 Tax=Croceivirga sp. JEA036 TaxID=2721162 RepID=UPI00143A0E09|nr:hypothetical protein [Croceivirga sp. JEA036]NJB36353.1 hypothetical protein [Croceivirga sp. JEA036]